MCILIFIFSHLFHSRFGGVLLLFIIFIFFIFPFFIIIIVNLNCKVLMKTHKIWNKQPFSRYYMWDKETSLANLIYVTIINIIIMSEFNQSPRARLFQFFFFYLLPIFLDYYPHLVCISWFQIGLFNHVESG